jgi:hypothetical protein
VNLHGIVVGAVTAAEAKHAAKQLRLRARRRSKVSFTRDAHVSQK